MQKDKLSLHFIPVILIFTSLCSAQKGIPLDSWPDSWFNPPQTASEMGISTFKEAPMLAAKVNSGKLPPVSSRLPDDPIVMCPYEKNGAYGGTIRVFEQDVFLINTDENALIMGPAVTKILPNLARDWKYTDGGRTFTLFLRKGIKWSDGTPWTADSYLFWYKHILLNEELTPVRPPLFKHLEMVKLDDYTVQFRFDQPRPLFVQRMAHSGENYSQPGHFLKDFHPDFVPRKELEARARAKGYMGWTNVFHMAKMNIGSKNWHTPTLRAYQLTKRSPTVIRYTRNPYYSKIDPAGQQLPYIDAIEVFIVDNAEVRAAKASTGQIDFAANSIQTQDIPLFKLGELAEPYRTLIWNRLHGTDVVIQPNLTCPDKRLRKIFQDLRFRKALSLAIDRNILNQIIYFGHGTPRQTTVIPSSKFYEPEFAESYIKYDPVTAGRLLDDMQLRDVDDDGLREGPDGRPLNIILEWIPRETPKQLTVELLAEFWREIGLDIKNKQISPGLQFNRARGNQMDMTIWHADRTSDVLFPLEPFWFVPMHNSWEECHWVLWSEWYLSEGEKGETPPPDIMKLLDWWTEMIVTMDEQRRIELGKNILRSQAQNLWTIGTIGLAPQPVIAADKLRNIPEHGYFGWDNRWTLPYRPSTWFLEQTEE